MSTIDLIVWIFITLVVVILLAYIVAQIDIYFMYKRINKQREQQEIMDRLKRQ